MKRHQSIRRRDTAKFTCYMVAGLCVMVLLSAASISFGAADMSLSTAWKAIFQYDGNLMEHQIIRTLRVPRTVADLLVGSSLSVCGAIMQGTTRNPLADPGLMGISSGAAFAMALCMAFLPERTYVQTMFSAFAGAAVTTGMTYTVASAGRKGMTPQKLVLAGISISMLFSALSQYISIKYRIGQSLAYWSAGGTAGAQWKELVVILPFFTAGLLTAVVLSPSITMMGMGEEAAVGLGLNTGRVNRISTVIVLILTGISVIVVGPVSFVGLITPHMVRYVAGADYRRIIPACAVYGALLTVLADLAGRLINKPYETPVGIVFSVIGVPYFLYLARRQRREFQ